jgi:hypothetical protein
MEPNQELLSYIKSKQTDGYGHEEIKAALLKAGWEDSIIERAFVLVNDPQVSSAQAAPPLPVQIVSLDTVGGLLDKSFKIFRERFVTLVGISFVPGIITTIIALVILLTSGFQSDLPSLLKSYFLQGNRSLTGLFFVIYLIVLVASFWSQVALLFSVHNKTNIVESYKKSYSKILSYGWIGFLSGLVVFAGILLFIVPGIIFAVWISLSAFVFIVEGEKGTRALAKSREYVRGYWWNVFVKLVALFGVAIIALIGIGIVVGIIGSIARLIPGGTFVSDILSTVFQAAISSFYMVYIYEMYKNLKEVKEAGGLAVAQGKKGLFIGLAILGVLFIIVVLPIAIFLASYGSAKPKAADVGIKSSLSGVRVSAEMYYGGQMSYEGLCGQASIKQYLDGVKKDGSNDIFCGATQNEYAISASLVSEKGKYFCVDSTGYSGMINAQLGSGVTACPKEGVVY